MQVFTRIILINFLFSTFYCSFSFNKEVLASIGGLIKIVNKYDVENIIDLPSFKNKKEYILQTKNISSINKNSFHAMLYVNREQKTIICYIRGTKIILYPSLFDPIDISDCINLNAGRLISKVDDIGLLAEFLLDNIPDIDKYSTYISGHSLGAICSDLLAVKLKQLIINKFGFYRKLRIYSITLDNPGSYNQFLAQGYNIQEIRYITSGIDFKIYQNSISTINNTLPQLRSNVNQLQFLLPLFQSNQNSLIDNIKYNALLKFCNLLGGNLASHLDPEEDDANVGKKVIYHYVGNVYAGIINKYFPTINVDDFISHKKQYFIDLIEKQNKELIKN